MTEMKVEVKSILFDLVSIDSQVTKSNKEIIDYLQKLFSNFKSFEQTLIPVPNAKFEWFNLILKLKGKSDNSPLVFAMHSDTVPVTGNWSTEPFTPTEKDGLIYGRGTTDMKGGCAAAISAVLNLKETPPQDIYLIFDADEEGGGTGVREVVKHLALTNARTIVPEPTLHNVLTSQKGCLDIEITFTGKAMHSSRTNLKNNLENSAIYKMNKFFNQLLEYEKEIEQKTDELLGSAVQNIGVIRGGAAPNIVADSCSIKISRRLIPGETLDGICGEYLNFAKRIDRHATLKRLFEGAPFKTSNNSSFVRHALCAVKKHFKESKISFTPAWTEAAFFERYGDVVVLGPGNSAQSHTVNEFVKLGDVLKFKEIFQEIMQENPL